MKSTSYVYTSSVTKTRLPGNANPSHFSNWKCRFVRYSAMATLVLVRGAARGGSDGQSFYISPSMCHSSLLSPTNQQQPAWPADNNNAHAY